MDRQIRLPIKVVLPSREDIQAPGGGGGTRKQFGAVSFQVRQALAHQVEHLEKYFAHTFDKNPRLPAVGKVVLKDKALAKSHRPSNLLKKANCPIIGVQNFGQLLVSVRPDGLRELRRHFLETASGTNIADISTIDRIEPYTTDDVVPCGLEDLRTIVQRGIHKLKFRLFLHHDTEMDHRLSTELRSLLSFLNLPPAEEIHYGDGLKIFRISAITPNVLEPIAQFVGTQSLAEFPSYQIVRTAAIAVRPSNPDDFPPPTSGQEYPAVGVVDSGVDATDSLLGPWVLARHEYVPPEFRDHDHGSFVGGLIVHPRRLNQDDPKFPGASSKIVDVVAVPKSGGISEDDLLTVLEEVLPKHPEVKVWNLSLGTNSTCDNHRFSNLAVALDRLQDQFGVTFVFAAGNFRHPPFRGWPPEDYGNDDRICSPADSARGVTVGSIAHLDRPTSRVKSGEPSPFSRCGPGPAFLPKPDLSHFGGNCDAKANYTQTGILSLDGRGNLAENVGTSFATPLVASVLANVRSLIDGPLSQNLMKCLVVHSAALNSLPITGQSLKYTGFGIPQDLPDILSCNPWSATLIFETKVPAGLVFIKDRFPIPACLRNPEGKIHGEFVITLVYDPPLDPRFGAEYCRTNVEVSLGNPNRQIPAMPKDVNLLYEKHLVEHGFKWSPVKVYKRSVQRIEGSNWRLRVIAQNRSGYSSLKPQDVAIIVTMRDLERKAKVYDETVTTINRLGWSTTDLRVRDRLRLTP